MESPSQGETHLDPRQVAGYLDRRLEEGERALVEEHLASCEECRREVVAVGGVLDSFEAPPAPRVRTRWVLPAGAVAAAAVVGILIAVPRTGDAPSEVLRRPVAPTGAGAVGRVAAVFPAEGAAVRPDSLLFRWDVLAEDVAYQFTLADEEGGPLWTTSTTATSVTLPPEEAARLEPARSYYWRVDALLPDLGTATTGQRSFTVRRP